MSRVQNVWSCKRRSYRSLFTPLCKSGRGAIILKSFNFSLYKFRTIICKTVLFYPFQAFILWLVTVFKLWNTFKSIQFVQFVSGRWIVVGCKNNNVKLLTIGSIVMLFIESCFDLMSFLF